jgi:hypothetical protein
MAGKAEGVLAALVLMQLQTQVVVVVVAAMVLEQHITAALAS